MKLFLTIVFALTMFGFRSSGSGISILTCKSETGRTLFYAELDDIVEGLQKAELKVDGKKLLFNNDDKSYAIFDPKNGVFTLFLTGSENPDFPNGRFVEFWAIPKTFKTIISNPGHQRYEFRGKIEATEPRKGADKDNRIPQVELICILDYEI